MVPIHNGKMGTARFLFINEHPLSGSRPHRVFGEAYFLYAAAGNPRRTQIRAKSAIYG